MVQPPLVAVAGHFNYLTSIRSIEKRNHLPLNATIPCFSMIRYSVEVVDLTCVADRVWLLTVSGSLLRLERCHPNPLPLLCVHVPTETQ